MSSAGKHPTLGRRLVLHMVTVLISGWIIASFGIVWVAAHFVQRAFDRVLVEDALLVAERVTADPSAPSGLSLKLTAA
ncbi:MAG: hypothetical protein EBV64_15240, partial [Oxalobacteraceae bacterium]|nr:hypothetical protein [Oxalobacteraceae bacterium]